MAEPMFEIENYLPEPGHQACSRCVATAYATTDQIRVRGWLVFDGPSVTGKQLHVRICPACQRKGA